MMQKTATPANLDACVRTTQVIVFSLVQGLVIFGAIAVFLMVTNGAQQNAEPMMISYMGVGMALAMIALRSYVPGQIVAAQRRELARGQDADEPYTLTPENLFGAFQVSTITAGALLEGAGFFNLVALIIERQWMNLIAAGVLVVLILALFPTRMSYDNWARQQLEIIEIERRQKG